MLDAYAALANEIFSRVYSDTNQDEMHHWLSRQVAKLATVKEDDAALPWLDSIEAYQQILDERQRMAALPEGERRLFVWPWATWNKIIDPLEPGLLAILAAGDGMGKTIYAENIAEHWARQGHKVLFAHFELNRVVMLDRRAARHTGIQRRTLKGGVFNPGEMEQIAAMSNDLPEWAGGITYLHCPGWSIEQVTNEAKRMQEDGLCDALIIDYLEKAGWSGHQMKLYRGNTFQKEASDVETVKNFSEQTEIPTFMLAQMNKGGKTKDFEDLNRTDMRGAGEKSEKANIVVLLHRENAESPLINVRVDKNTLGATGSFQQYLLGARFRVADVVKEEL